MCHTTHSPPSPANDHPVRVDFNPLEEVVTALIGQFPSDVLDSIAEEVRAIAQMQARPVTAQELEYCYLQGAVAARIMQRAISRAITVLQEGRSTGQTMYKAMKILDRALDANGVIATGVLAEILMQEGGAS